VLNRVALTLIIGVLSCGCADPPEATTDEVAQPTSIPGPNSIPKQGSAATRVEAYEFRGPRDVMVEGRLTVDVMEIASPPRASELAQRLQQAAREDPDWWREHVKKAEPGEPLPYDSRLGLSEAEYKEFLALSNKMTTQKKAEATLIITEDNDVYVLDGGQALADFTGIEIDLDNDLVRTPFGVLTKRTEIEASEGSALGAWAGTQWRLEDPDSNGIVGTVAKLAVGKLKQSGRCVIYYDVRKISPGGKKRISHVLNYDVPSTESSSTK
jgi:hypothetical protein